MTIDTDNEGCGYSYCGNLLIQFGWKFISSDGTISFAISFPNRVLSISSSLNSIDITVQLNDLTVSGCSAHIRDTDGDSGYSSIVRYIAIGY